MATGLGFVAACEMQPGDRVRVGGIDREVIDVRHVGRDWPYFQLRAERQTAFELAGPDWVSWQTCGRAAVPAGWDHL
jgi:hypothetical protein